MMRLKIAIFSIIYIIFCQQALAAGSLDRRIDAATEVLEDMAKMPEKGIPPSLLSSAYAVAVIPNSIKAGFFVGGSFGRGILVVRQADGGWSNPTFVSLGGGSLGWQIGAQSSDLVIVFKNRKGVDNIANGKITLGADAAIAAGPVGRYTSAATDGRLRAEIYSYSRNRGLFAGVSLEGAWMRMDNRANFAYYDNGQGSAAKILQDSHMPKPAHARRFVETLTAATRGIKAPAVAVRPERESERPTANQEDSGGVQTFAIDEAPAPQTDTIF